MAYGVKVSAIGILSCVLSFAWASAVIITNDGKEADAAKAYAEEVLVEAVLTVTSNEQRKGRNKSEKVAAEGATIELKRHRRSPEGGHRRSPSYIPFNNFPLNSYQPFGFRPFQHQNHGINGQNGNQQPGFPNNGLPQNGYPNNGLPQNGYPNNGLPQNGYPNNGEHGFQNNGYPQDDFQNNGYPQGNLQNSGYEQNGPQNHGNGFQPGISQMPGPIRGQSNFAGSQVHNFDASTPLGDFGGTSSNSLAHGITVDENGIRGSVGISGNQEFRLPNGQKLVVNYANGFNTDNGDSTNAGSNSVVLTGPNGEFLQAY